MLRDAKRRKTGLNDRFDRMVETMSVRHRSPTKTPKRRKKPRSSSFSSASELRTPVDDYHDVQPERLGKNFAVIKMGTSAGLHQRPDGNEDDDEVVSGWQPASPPPLPTWLASTFTTLNKKHPLRLLLPCSSAAPDPVQERKVITSKPPREGREDDIFAFKPPNENDLPPLEQDAPPILLQSPFSHASNNAAQSPLLSRACTTPSLATAPDAPFSTPGPAPPSQCSMPPPPLFNDEQVSQVVQRATSRPPSSMYAPTSGVHRPTSRLSSHPLPRTIPQVIPRSESPNWLHSPPGSAYPASILQRSSPRRDPPPTASDLRVRYAPTPELLRARRVTTAMPPSPTPLRSSAPRFADEDRENTPPAIDSAADPAYTGYMLPAGRATEEDNTCDAPNNFYFSGDNDALDAPMDAHACMDIEDDMYACYDDANTTLTASDPVVTPFAHENGDEYYLEEHDDTLVDDGNTSGDTADRKLGDIPDVFSTPGPGHYVYFDAPTSDPSEEDEYAVVSGDTAESKAFETTECDVEGTLRDVEEAGRDVEGTMRDVEGTRQDFAATNKNNTAADEDDEAPIDYGQLGVDYDALDFSWKPFDRKGVPRDRREPSRSQERSVQARGSPPRSSVSHQPESARRQPSSVHRQPSSVHRQPSSAHRQPGESQPHPLQPRPASQASQPRFLGSIIYAAYGTRRETAPRQAAHVQEEPNILPFPLTSSQRAPVTPVRAPRPAIQVPQAGSESTLSPVREEDGNGSDLLGALDALQGGKQADVEERESKKEDENKDDVSPEKTPGPAFAPAPGIYLSPLHGDASSGSQQMAEGDKTSAKPVSTSRKPASPLIVPKKELGTGSGKNAPSTTAQHSFATRRRSGVSKPRSAKVLWSTPSEVLSLDDDSSSIESWDD
ncbi:hypothetical protein K525DRAFT_265378 [Schizophyllum commune Loenen D]|nr:hypothetical protein K525DRAFT_265378 [Schizophyllum commune Loenen D]